MSAVYGCRHAAEAKRTHLTQQWRGVVERFAITTSPKVLMLEEFFRDQPPASWLSRYPVYNENYMSMLSSNKWTLLQDPNDLSIAYLQSQNPSLVTADFGEKNLVETLRYAATKGQEVLVINFYPPCPPALADLFERKLNERVQAFVGLIGVPYLRKDNRVTVGGQEISCHPKFFLTIHTRADMQTVNHLAKDFNLVGYEYGEAAMLKKLAELSMPPELAEAYAGHVGNIERLERSVAERKEEVLSILIRAGEEFIDSVNLVASLKEAKAKVFESQNDLVLERKQFALLADTASPFLACSRRVKCFVDLCDVLKTADASFAFSPDSVFLIMRGEAFSRDSSGCQLYARIANRCLERVIFAVLPRHRLKLLVFAALTEVLPVEALGDAVREFRNCVCHRGDLRCCVELLLQRHKVSVGASVDDFLREKSRSGFKKEADLASQILRLSESKPIILLCNEDSDKILSATDFVRLLNRKAGNSRPPEYFCGEGASIEAINDVVRKATKGRWLVLDGVAGRRPSRGGAHLDQIDSPAVGGRLFLIGRHGRRTGAFGSDKFQAASIAMPEHTATRRAIIEELMTTAEVETDPAKKQCLSNLVRLHMGLCETTNAALPLRMVEIMVEKCAAVAAGGAEESSTEYVAKAARHVYGIEDDLAAAVWRRVIQEWC